jgi:excisionase family DNA binding protein
MYLWTINELSSSTKLAISTLRHYVSDGLIPVVRIGRTVRFDPEEIKAWITAGGPTSITSGSKK